MDSLETIVKRIIDSWIRAYPLSNKTDVEVCLLLPKVQKELLEELGVVAQKIRDKIDEGKKDHRRFKQRRDATDSIAAKRNYDELQLITRGYVNALHDVLALLVEGPEGEK